MIALVRIQNPVEIVELRASSGGWIDIPGIGKLSPAEPGWKGNYFTIVEVQRAGPPPEGKRVVGREYQIGGTGYNRTVTEVLVLEDVPEEVILQRYASTVQSHIDATARERGYDSGVSIISYLSDPNPVWATEAVTFNAWRSSVWAYAFEVEADVRAGNRTMPTPEELIAELPQIQWPGGE